MERGTLTALSALELPGVVADPNQNMTQLVEGAGQLEAAVQAHFVAELPPVTLASVSENMSGLLARFVLERQLGAIRSAVILTKESLGHFAFPLVRPALDERIWLTYIYGIPTPQRARLLTLLSAAESFRALAEQQEFLGTETMQGLDFPPKFVRAANISRKRAEKDLAELGRHLMWPRGIDGWPSTGWVAEQTELEGLYRFLDTATSKGLHFSPSEASRSSWTSGPEPEATITPFSTRYRSYRTAFSLHWLSMLLLETASVVAEHGLADGESSGNGLDEVAAAVKRIGVYANTPIVLASEFNLRTSDETG